MIMNTEKQNLLATMREAFNEDELRDICFSLQIDFEDLPSSLGKAGKIRELILITAQNSQLTMLITICRKERPDYEWPDPQRIPQLELLLGKEAKPIAPYEPEMVWVEAGDFWMGRDVAPQTPIEETPQHQLFLPTFQIAKFPVTNAQYVEFLKQKRLPSPKGWLGSNPPRDVSGQSGLQLPVVNVSWFDAVAYCAWLAEVTERPYRLPTEAEWEKAARGPNGQLYPWGDEWDLSGGHFQGSKLSVVGAYTDGESPYGCFDMLGNVREWVSTAWGSQYDVPDYLYPYDSDDGRESLEVQGEIYRIVRGSSFNDPQTRHLCTTRAWYAPKNKHKSRGFRVALSW